MKAEEKTAKSFDRGGDAVCTWAKSSDSGERRETLDAMARRNQKRGLEKKAACTIASRREA